MSAARPHRLSRADGVPSSARHGEPSCQGGWRAAVVAALAAEVDALIGPERAAAQHVVACLAWQRRNIEAHRRRGVFFTYETMCAAPERVAQTIRALVPALDDLDLRRRVPVKGRYDEELTDMNARQIARLTREQIAAFNDVFRRHRELLAYFGYPLRDGETREPTARVVGRPSASPWFRSGPSNPADRLW